jgi:hypothetical protein
LNSTFPSPRAGVLPPMEYDYPPNGDVIIQRGDKEKMEKECPKTPYPITFACAFRLAGTPKGKPWPYCRIVIANADILRDAPWSYETILRHEFGHCNGWPKDHKGARPLGARAAEQ